MSYESALMKAVGRFAKEMGNETLLSFEDCLRLELDFDVAAQHVAEADRAGRTASALEVRLRKEYDDMQARAAGYVPSYEEFKSAAIYGCIARSGPAA